MIAHFALADILPTVSLSPDIRVGREPPETAGTVQQPHGKALYDVEAEIPPESQTPLFN